MKHQNMLCGSGSSLRLCCWLLLCVVASYLSTANEASATTNKVACAFYFYWYDIDTGDHLVDPDGSDSMTHHPPDSYTNGFSYKHVEWHRRELSDMMAAKIDVVLPVYWGSDAESYWSRAGLSNLVLAVQDMRANGESAPSIGMFYDTSALQQQNAGSPPDLTTAGGKVLFYSMIGDFFRGVPSNLWARIDNRPLIYLYTSGFVSNYSQGTFDYVVSHFSGEFGVTPYLVREASWQNVTTDGKYTWGVALNGPVVDGGVGCVGPGFDDTAVYGRDEARIRDRQCGTFYNDAWEEISSSDPSLVSIETWNEFHEATEVAATREYGTTFIALTAANIQRWKSADYGAGSFVWLAFGQHSYCRGLRPAFNYQDGAWLVTNRTGREAAYPDHSTSPYPSYYIYLDVNDQFIHAVSTQVWVTVEYLDEGTDQWWIEYDSTGNPHRPTTTVTLQNTRQWKPHTFCLSDAYFGGREANGADLRLMDGDDGPANYFGRVWISKTAPSNDPPNLVVTTTRDVFADEVSTLTISATDPNGDGLALELDRTAPFAVLTDKENGTGTLAFAPTQSHWASAPYSLRVVATDSGSPPLSDAVSLEIMVRPRRPRFTSALHGGNTLTLCVTNLFTGATHVLETTSSLMSTNWLPLRTFTAVTNGQSTNLTQELDAGLERAFYRLQSH